MLQAHHIYKSYGAQVILDDVSFAINPGERVGLIGPNGSGKTTLLRILIGQEPPDQGLVILAHSTTLGYLPQGLETVLAHNVGEYIAAGIPGYKDTRQQVERLASQLAEQPGNAPLLQQYGVVLSRFEALGGYALEHRIEAVLKGLGLTNIDLATSIQPLSGGERTRISLARLLLAEPSLLLLDEPTNHLDIDALEWLEGFLAEYRGALLVVSHDRTFLDNTVGRILELDERTRHVREYSGNYSAYAAQKELEFQKQWGVWKDQVAEIRNLEQDVTRTKDQALRTEKGTRNDHMRRLAKKVAAKAKAKEKRLERYLDSPERVEKPVIQEKIRLDFGTPLRPGQVVARLSGVGQQFESRWLYQEVDQVLQHGERVALVGPNGSGKTTLLRILMREIQPTCGQVYTGGSVHFGYMSQQQETLDVNATTQEVIQAAAPLSESEVFHFLHFFLFEPEEVRRQVGKLSYGERARLLLARLVASGANCLLLDEPINHLDIPSREQFELALSAFPGAVLVSVHDRAFIDRFATSTWRIKTGKIVKEYS